METRITSRVQRHGSSAMSENARAFAPICATTARPMYRRATHWSWRTSPTWANMGALLASGRTCGQRTTTYAGPFSISGFGWRERSRRGRGLQSGLDSWRDFVAGAEQPLGVGHRDDPVALIVAEQHHHRLQRVVGETLRVIVAAESVDRHRFKIGFRHRRHRDHTIALFTTQVHSQTILGGGNE